MGSRLDHELDQLADELARLTLETTALTRNFSIEDAFAMQSGEPRSGAAANERMVREKFARMRKIEAVINTHHGN